eukprot:Transcript_31336.p1 GENE.Transcript_31336~~Transcript_31336.p1  ORF type:complete len:258 (-),score=16.57 Transcript_31336:1252-2025(-)
MSRVGIHGSAAPPWFRKHERTRGHTGCSSVARRRLPEGLSLAGPPTAVYIRMAPRVFSGTAAMLRGVVWLVSVVVQGAVVRRVSGPDESEITHASAGGGVSVYLTGSALGTPFNPPTVLVGTKGDAECVVQGFTSSLTRLHCIIGAAGLPPPSLSYTSSGSFQDLPLYVIKAGKRADCWHVGGANHGCFLRFDLGGTPRITQVRSPVLQAASFLRLAGSGIDGGLLGAPLAEAKLRREADGVLVGCRSRYDDTDAPS